MRRGRYVGWARVIRTHVAGAGQIRRADPRAETNEACSRRHEMGASGNATQWAGGERDRGSKTMRAVRLCCVGDPPPWWPGKCCYASLTPADRLTTLLSRTGEQSKMTSTCDAGGARADATNNDA